MPRLFTGVEIPHDIALALSAFRGGLPGARWIEPESYHLTLRFIGDVDRRTAAEIDAALRQAGGRGPLEIVMDGLDSFGGDKPRAVFARVRPSPDLLALRDAQERAMRRIGLPPEPRRFSPHVTLARLRHASPLDLAAYFSARGHFPKLAFTARRIALFSARESTGGGPYIVEAAYPLE